MKTRILLTSILLASAAHAADCCDTAAEPKSAPARAHASRPDSPAPPEDACCKPDMATESVKEFTRDSIYQSDAVFTDDSGHAFQLGQLRGRPVVIDLFFASCGYACPITVTDLLAVQAELSPGIRKDAVFVLVSFDTRRDTVEALANYRVSRQLNSNWILLRGDDASVRELAALLGIKYKQEADGSFAHSNIFSILNREGEIVHQRTGLKGGLGAAIASLDAL